MLKRLSPSRITSIMKNNTTFSTRHIAIAPLLGFVDELNAFKQWDGELEGDGAVFALALVNNLHKAFVHCLQHVHAMYRRCIVEIAH